MREKSEPNGILREIQPVFLHGMSGKIKEFGDLLDRLAEKQDDISAVEDFYRIAHNIRGSGASYGLPAISEVGERMEFALEGVHQRQEKVDEALLNALKDFVNSLKEIVQEYKDREG